MSAPPDDRDGAPGDDPFADAPDRWAEADAAWARKWSDDPDADEPAEEPLDPPPDSYRPARPTTASVTRAYGGGMQAAGPYIGLGMQIAASMLLFVGLGYLADRYLGTSPWGLLVGAVLGMVGIVALVVRVANEASRKD